MDINNDNNNDLIIGDATGKVFYYPGTDNGEFGAEKDILFTDSTTIMFTGTVVSKPVMYDYNNDGLLDMLTANSKRGLVWEKHPINVHLNVGTAQNPIFKKQPKDLGIKATKGSVAMGDMDGDNLPDLVVSNHGSDNSKHIYFHKNIGTLEEPKWDKGKIIKFKGTSIYRFFLKSSDYDGKTLDSLTNTGFYWVMAGKAVSNISIADYNDDGRNDLLLGFKGFSSSGENEKDGYKYTYQQTIVNVYYSPEITTLEKPSPKKLNNYFSVRGDNLYFDGVQKGRCRVTIYSIKGEKLFTKTIENMSPERSIISLNENSLAKGLYIVNVVGDGFNEKIKIKRF